MVSIVKQALRLAVPKRYRKYWDIGFGYFDYFTDASLLNKWGGPFNGQTGRRQIFDAIVRLQDPKLIVETGTFRGATTEALATAGVPVVSIEGTRRYYGFAEARLRRLPNVTLRLGDSREELRNLFRELGAAEASGRLFAYLDAHWFADLPLREELDFIFAWDRDAIVMIDDFRVPDDAGYGYDDYGPGAALNSELIDPAVNRFQLATLYPLLASGEESGMRRGCAVLASDRRWKAALLSTGLLKQVELNALPNPR